MTVENKQGYTQSEIVDLLRLKYPGREVGVEDQNVFVKLVDGSLIISPDREGIVEISFKNVHSNKSRWIALGICSLLFAAAKVVLENYTSFSIKGFFSLNGLIFGVAFVACWRGLEYVLSGGAPSSYGESIVRAIAGMLSKERPTENRLLQTLAVGEEIPGQTTAPGEWREHTTLEWREAVAGKDVNRIMSLRKIDLGEIGISEEEAYREAFQALNDGILELEQLANRIEAKPGAPLPEELSGAFILRKHFDTNLMNALPPYFDEVKTRICHVILRICKFIYKSENSVALGLIHYGLGIVPEGDTKLLLTQVVDRIKSRRPNLMAKEKTRSGISPGIAILIFILVAIVVSAAWTAVKVINGFKSRTEQIVQAREAIVQKQDLQARENALTDSIMRSDVGDLGAPHGLIPMKRCYPPRPRLEGTSRKLRIEGDDHSDAIVFLFNGDRNVGQVYVEAGKSVVWQGAVEGSPISTLIVFGKAWDPKKANPCGEPGWFSTNVAFAGFASYATYPYPVEFSSGHTGFQLRRGRLHKTRELSSEKFFELLREYR